ncbi:MAG: DUF1015 domain-containing protein [Actinomycetota bacterium]
MVEVLPLKGLRYNQKKIGDLSKVISPPYDLISANLEKKLKKLSPYNITNLILPERVGSEDKYMHAAGTLKYWLKNEILVLEGKPSFYLLEETFKDGNEIKSLKGFIGLSKIEDYGPGKVLRHENTLVKPKEDRLRLLGATKANFGLIYTVYRDSTALISSIMGEYKPSIIVKPCYDQTLFFKLWKVSDPEEIKQIKELMGSKTILIADGHHRYETSRIYSRKSKGKGSLSRDYVLTLFVNSNQKGLSVNPTYRLIKLKDNFNQEKLFKNIERYFTLEKITQPENRIIRILARESAEKHKSFILYLGKNQVYMARYKENLLKNNVWENLDVNILHNILINKAIRSLNIEKISFTHLAGELKKKVNHSYYDLGIMLNAPTVKQVETLSGQGLLMPQKSTYFYPKPCTGLVMYKFND